jgi:sigma-E factor negative regulatory protein RseA
MSNEYTQTIHEESLSALMDGEAQELELRRLLRQLPDDPELRARWARYQLASSILHKQQCFPAASLKLADAVQMAVRNEFSYEGSGVTKWRRSAVRFAVAASVALAVVVGVQWEQQRTAVTTQLADAVPTTPDSRHAGAASLESVATVPLLASKPLAGSAFMPARGKQYGYMQYNLERASLDTNGSMVPLAPVSDRFDYRK